MKATAAASSPGNLRTVDLDDAALAPFRAQIEGWLAQRKVEAVLVRPDRYVFGAGSADALARAWAEQSP